MIHVYTCHVHACVYNMHVDENVTCMHAHVYSFLGDRWQLLTPLYHFPCPPTDLNPTRSMAIIFGTLNSTTCTSWCRCIVAQSVATPQSLAVLPSSGTILERPTDSITATFAATT